MGAGRSDQPRRPPSDLDLPPLAALVVHGMLDDAVTRVAADPTCRSDRRAATAALRARGEHEAADLLDLVGRNPDAAALVLGPGRRFDPLGRLAVMAVILTASFVSPWLLVPGLAAIAYVPIRWSRRTRARLDDDERALLDRWRQERWREAGLGTDQHWIPLAFAGLVVVVAAIAVANGGWVVGAVLTAVAVACVLWWRRVLRRQPGEDGHRTIVRGAIPTSTSHAVAPTGAVGRPTLPAGALPLRVPRPRIGAAVFPAALLGSAAVGVLFATGTAALGWVAGLGALGAILGWRAAATELVLDASGVRDRGILRTRIYPWNQVSEVRAAANGEQRARLELVTARSVHTIWTGWSVDRMVALGPAVGAAMSSGSLPTRRPSTAFGCLLSATLVLVGSMATIVALGVATDSPTAPVDPSTLPEGTEVVLYYDTQLGTWGRPRLPCPAPVESLTGEVPAPCREELQTLWTITGIAGAIAGGAWGVLVVLAVRRRRNSEPALP